MDSLWKPENTSVRLKVDSTMSFTNLIPAMIPLNPAPMATTLIGLYSSTEKFPSLNLHLSSPAFPAGLSGLSEIVLVIWCQRCVAESIHDPGFCRVYKCKGEAAPQSGDHSSISYLNAHSSQRKYRGKIFCLRPLA